MDERYITKASITKVLSCYWEQYKSHPWQSIFAFLLPSIGTILIFFVPPLLLGKIINTFIAQGTVSVAPVLPYLIYLAIAWMSGEILWRIGQHNIISLESKGLGTLNMMGFGWLADRDYDFYTNHFVGSLTKKPWLFLEILKCSLTHFFLMYLQTSSHLYSLLSFCGNILR